MSKKILINAMLVISPFVFCQVGINTTTPQKTLHINGSAQLTNELNVGGDGSKTGSSGSSGQVLTSQGLNKAPSWVTPSVSSSDVVAKLYLLGLKFINETTNRRANSPATILYDQTPILNSIDYNFNTGDFTVKETGYYQIILYTHYNLSRNASGNTGGTASSQIRNVTQNTAFAIQNAAYDERTNDIYHTVAAVGYIRAGDVIRTTMNHTVPYRIYDANVSFMYLGNGR